MAKCVVCKTQAAVRIDYANASFCIQHFIEFYERKIKKILKKVPLREKCILVALSGGKDSISLLYALYKLREEFGYKLKALHINLGIGEYSEKSLKISQTLCEKLDIPLIIYDVNQNFGWGIPEASKAINRPACGVCGLVKRWIMNKVAREEKCDYVATGHNLDDVNAFGLKALLTGRVEDVLRMPGPIIEGDIENGLVGRLRPQFYLTELENTLYAQFNNLEFIDTTCPLAKNTTQHKYKSIWETINKINPVGKINFAKSLEKIRVIAKDEKKLSKCKICGQPTIEDRDICYFCTTRMKIEKGLKYHQKLKSLN